MKRVIIFLFVACATLVSGAKIDLSKIKSFVAQSPIEYKGLVDRFVQADTTLTIEELSTVYYGTPFYVGFTMGKYDAQLEDLYINASTVEQYDVVSLVAQRALNESPASFDLIVKAIVGANNGSDENAKEQLENLRTRYAMIFAVINASGSGILPEGPFYVISQSDKLRYLAHGYGAIEVLDESGIKDCKAVKINRIAGDDVKDAIIYVKIID